MKVLLFARARDVVGADCIDVDDAPTVGALRQRLIQQYPKLASLAEKSAFAVNDEFADDSAAIPPGAEVALLPPVSGG
jgi:molybdopterin converting factor subunit 1